MTQPKKEILELGKHVEKITGDYTFEGTVVADFFTLAGKRRLVVEHDGTHMLHIFSEGNLRVKRDIIQGHHTSLDIDTEDSGGSYIG